MSEVCDFDIYIHFFLNLTLLFLFCYKQALNKLQTIQRVSTTSGIEQEEQLLQESAKKEENFSVTLGEFERELKQV